MQCTTIFSFASLRVVVVVVVVGITQREISRILLLFTGSERLESDKEIHHIN